MNIEETLKNIGFKDKKARVYRACLELGQANAQEIAKRAEDGAHERLRDT